MLKNKNVSETSSAYIRGISIQKSFVLHYEIFNFVSIFLSVAMLHIIQTMKDILVVTSF